MSIRNLMTTNEKPDQNLQVSSIFADSITVNNLAFNTLYGEFSTITHDFNTGQSTTTTTPCGFVTYTNLPTLAPADAHVMLINYTPIIEDGCVVLVSGNQQGTAENIKLCCEIDTLDSGQFGVRITNLATTNWTNASYSFTYLVILPTPIP